MLADFLTSICDEWYSPKCGKNQIKKFDISRYFQLWLSAMKAQEKNNI